MTPCGCRMVLISGRSLDIGQEVSAVTVLCGATLPSPILAVSTWTGTIMLTTFTSLASSSATYEITETSYAASLLLKTSPSSPTTSTSGVQLLAGLSEGSLVTYDLQPSDDGPGGVVVANRKASSLGTQPLRLCAIKGWQSEEEQVVAVGLSERTSVLFESRNRIDFSSISKKASTSMGKALRALTSTRASLPLRAYRQALAHPWCWPRRRACQSRGSTR